MGLQSVLYVDDFDMATLGVVVEKVTGLGDIPEVSPRTRALYARAGMVEVSAVRALGPRKIVVVGAIGAATVAALETAIDNVKARLGSALVAVRFSTPAGREWSALCTTFVVGSFPGPSLLHVYRQFTLTLTALDPYGYDVSYTAVAFGATAMTAPIGSAPSAPLLRISGAATNPVVTVRNGMGVAVGSVGLTLTLAAGDYVELDCDAMTITKSVSGTISDALTTLASGDWPLLDPDDGAVTLEVSAGTGEAIYRKAWL